MSIDPNAVGMKPTPSNVNNSFSWSGGDNGPMGEVAQGEMSFGDFLDIVNPLHHIPVVGSVYRSLTGDTIQTSSRIMGGALYGGPIGLMAAAAESGWEAESGRSVGGTVLAMARGEPMRDPARASPIDAAIAQAVPEQSVAPSVVPTIAGASQTADAGGGTGFASDAVPTIAAQAYAAQAYAGVANGVRIEPLAPPAAAAVPTISAQARTTPTQTAAAVTAPASVQMAQIPNARTPYAASPYAVQPQNNQRILDYDQAAAGLSSPTVTAPPAAAAPMDPQSLMNGVMAPTGVSKNGLPTAGAATPASTLVQMNAYGSVNPAQMNAAVNAAGPGLDAGALNYAAPPSAASGVAAQTAPTGAPPGRSAASPPPAAAPQARSAAQPQGLALPQRTINMQSQTPQATQRREVQTSSSFVPPPRSDFISSQRRDQRTALAQPAAPAPSRPQQVAPNLAPQSTGPTTTGVAGPPGPPANVSDQMLKALDKYDALMRNRKAGPTGPSDQRSSVAPIDAVL